MYIPIILLFTNLGSLLETERKAFIVLRTNFRLRKQAYQTKNDLVAILGLKVEDFGKKHLENDGDDPGGHIALEGPVR